ncbi:MAG: hypothetical protein ACT6Q7_02695 [Blastomonas fulva]|uniref:hypothetical protein n=1 Tax=Blastomonas fulva TaxID=1550728 RepID=UPI004034D7AF
MSVIDTIAIGDRFGAWTVTAKGRRLISGDSRRVCFCRCDCGTDLSMEAYALTSGGTTRCRTCSNRNKANMSHRLTHGGSETRLYRIWMLMRRRCSALTNPDYPNYGGRGISVCSEWNDFAAFREWANGNGYEAHLTIDRRDNNGNYEPGNCRWVGRKAQNRNRRDNIRYQWRGRQMLLSEIAEITGLPYSLIRQRVRRDGWQVERAASTPPGTRWQHEGRYNDIGL